MHYSTFNASLTSSVIVSRIKKIHYITVSHPHSTSSPCLSWRCSFCFRGPEDVLTVCVCVCVSGVCVSVYVCLLLACDSCHPQTCCRCDTVNEGQSDQAHCHGPGSGCPHDRVAELGQTVGGAVRGHRACQPAAGKGEEDGKRCLQRPQ